jgi:hypothetical protein
MLSSLVMLNLVVGVVCSAMAQATQDHQNMTKKDAMLNRVVDETKVSRKIIDAWCEVKSLWLCVVR